MAPLAPQATPMLLDTRIMNLALCSVSVIPANKLSMQELNPLNGRC